MLTLGLLSLVAQLATASSNLVLVSDESSVNGIPVPTCGLSYAALAAVLASKPREERIIAKMQIYREDGVPGELWAAPAGFWALLSRPTPEDACIIAAGIKYDSVKIGILPQEMQ